MKIFILFICFSCSVLALGQDLIPYTKDQLWGFSDLEKNIIIAPKYKSVHFFQEGLAKVQSNENGKYGIINGKDEIIVPFQYASKELKGYSQDRILFVEGEKYGFLNGKGEVVIPAKYDFTYSFTTWATPVKMEGKYGMIDKDGKLVLPFEYPTMSSLSELGYVTIYTEEGNGVMDLYGNIVVPPKYKEKGLHKLGRHPIIKQNFAVLTRKDGVKDKTVLFNNGQELLLYSMHENMQQDHFFNQKYLLVNTPTTTAFSGSKRALIDIDGNIVLSWNDYAYIGTYNNQAVVIGQKKGDEIVYGLIDISGKTILKPKYEQISNFDEKGIALFEFKGEYGFLNDKGEIVINERIFEGVKSFGFLSDGLIYFKDENRGGIMTYEGEVVFKNSEQYQYFFSDYGFIKRRDSASKKQVLMRRNGEVISAAYDQINERDYGFQIKNDKKEGILDTSGNVILPAEYEQIDAIRNNCFIVKKNKRKGVVDQAGNEVLACRYKDIRTIKGSSNYWVQNEQTNWMMIDEVGTPINSSVYRKIEFYKQGYFNVYNGNWGVVDKNGTEVVPLVCKVPIEAVKHKSLFGIVKTGSVVYGYIGNDFTLYWD